MFFFGDSTGRARPGQRRRVRTLVAEQEAVDAERGRLARELHDTVAQELAFIRAQSAQLAADNPDEPTIALIASSAERALGDLREAIYSLQLERSASIGAALEGRAQELATRGGLELTVEVADGVEASAEAEHAVMRIVQEAISNTARHAEATAMSVDVGSRDDSLVVRIADDGRGFDPASATTSESGGFGLVSMRERVRSLGGEISFDSAPGRGTTIEFAVP
jgi:signal transduction histidine kinase